MVPLIRRPSLEGEALVEQVLSRKLAHEFAYLARGGALHHRGHEGHLGKRGQATHDLTLLALHATDAGDQERPATSSPFAQELDQLDRGGRDREVTRLLETDRQACGKAHEAGLTKRQPAAPDLILVRLAA